MKYLLITVCWIFSALGQDISIQKCQEYSKAVFQEEDQMFSWRRQSKPKLISTCAAFENPLIVGGTNARVKEFPHMALIGFGPTEESDMDWMCGGSLISEKHVLTAAHCTTSQSGPPQKVRLGSIDIRENDDYVQELIIEKSLTHPEYKRPIKYHDIAVLFLKQDVVFSAFVRPACLNTVEKINYTIMEAIGFGKKSHADQTFGEQLQKVNLNIIPRENCTDLQFREYEMPRKLIKEMLCAGNLRGGKDTCQGDSGGPLQVLLDEPYCMYNIVGVTSFGRGCGMAYSPGIYTKVDSYVPWIESTIWRKTAANNRRKMHD